MYQLLLSQYEIVKGARHALFTYCETMHDDDIFKKVVAFNNSSISDLLVHNANTYISWVDNFGMDGACSFYTNDDVTSLNDIKLIFDVIDMIVNNFLKKYNDDYLQPQTRHIARKGITFTLTPLQLFTHVITHEFHHKGQMLTMSRLLGYIPVDTDAIRT
ncbi:MAG TPA: DinB family protein [Mucilaginibacter sp.]|nr:DinB family protein [Mucilaginibacter sp.]